MSSYMDEVRREERQRRQAIAASRAPFLFVFDERGYEILIDVCTIRSVAYWSRPLVTPGATIKWHDGGSLNETYTALSVDAISRLLSEYGIVIINASEAR